MIIDSHLHIAYINIKKEIETLIHNMKLVGVDKTCLMPNRAAVPQFYANKSDLIKQAEITKKIVENNPDKFFPLFYANPIINPKDLIDIVKKYIIDGPIIGVKLIIEMNARDGRLEPLIEFLEKHNIPVLFHAWYKTVMEYKHESAPSDIADLASRHPGLRILMAHVTGCRQRGVQDIKKHKNVLIDTSGSQPEDGYMEYALKEIGADRILFGSDYPGRDIATQLGRIESVKLKREEKEKILYKNALSFFRK
jgi:hypothetical protein